MGQVFVKASFRAKSYTRKSRNKVRALVSSLRATKSDIKFFQTKGLTSLEVRSLNKKSVLTSRLRKAFKTRHG